MKIRFATIEDLPELIEVGRQFQAITRFRSMRYDVERLEKNLRGVIESKSGGHCFFVAEDSAGRIAGVLIGTLDRHIFSDLVVASLVIYVVLPEKRMSGAGVRLLAAFRKWAENRGAREINAGINSGAELGKTDKFLRRLGFRATGGNYSLLLEAKAA